MKYILTILILSLSTIAAFPNSADTTNTPPDTLYLSLDSCTAMALRNNIEVQKAALTIEKAQYEKNALLSLYFPKIQANGGMVYVFKDPQLIQSIEGFVPPLEINNSNIPDVLLNLINEKLGKLRTGLIDAWKPINISLKGAYMAGITLTQPIFAGGRIMAGNQMGEIGYQMAQDNYSLKREETYFNATQSYWLFISVREKLRMAETYEKLLLEVEAMVKNVEQADMLNKSDLLKVQVQLNDIRLKVTQARNGLELSKMALCHTIGADYSTTIIPTDTIIAQHATEIDINLLQVPDSVIENRLEYKLLKNIVNMKDRQVRLLLGEYLPTVGLAASYGIIGGIEIMGTKENPINMANIMGTVSIPITHWWEGSQKLKSAKIDRSIAELELKDKAHLMELQIRQATFNFAEAYKQLANTKFALKQSEESLRLATDRYEVQLETIVNLMGAQAEWQNAYSAMIDAHINYQLKEIEFLKATAQLNTSPESE